MILTLAALLLLGLHLATVLLAHRQMTREVRSGRIPKTTLIRPVCGLDPLDGETLGSSFTLSPPAAEILFCAARSDDAAIPLVRELIARNPGAGARLLIGEDRIGGNPKLNNVVKGWTAARHDRIVMADSNVLLPTDYLSILDATWTDGTGLVSAPACGIRPLGMAARVECAVLNGNQARAQLAAAALDLGFAQGKTLCFDRRVMSRAGGMDALGRDLAEDVGATKAIRAQGLKVRLTPRPFPQPVGQRSWRAVWDRQLRWSRVRRAGFPAIFLFEPLNNPLLVALALLPAGPAAALAALSLCYGSEALLARRGGWSFGAADLLACLIRDALLPAIWVATFLRPGFSWRGTEMAPDSATGQARPT